MPIDAAKGDTSKDMVQYIVLGKDIDVQQGQEILLQPELAQSQRAPFRFSYAATITASPVV
ncbi:hypothetical protein O9K51_11125 [Purpureocillium lavendulum]|uniref:Uncharacterized protein n=1 Tax=Purpureocillium lavendulum TaxID=1247861 RepID=A0AB34FBR3_9HYPO|nr:hypothetical protein O9K51_11125 [Purpureocillium lavendulum]